SREDRVTSTPSREKSARVLGPPVSARDPLIGGSENQNRHLLSVLCVLCGSSFGVGSLRCQKPIAKSREESGDRRDRVIGKSKSECQLLFQITQLPNYPITKSSVPVVEVGVSLLHSLVYPESVDEGCAHPRVWRAGSSQV